MDAMQKTISNDLHSRPIAAFFGGVIIGLAKPRHTITRAIFFPIIFPARHASRLWMRRKQLITLG
jgi:hypothetical protein